MTRAHHDQVARSASTVLNVFYAPPLRPGLPARPGHDCSLCGLHSWFGPSAPQPSCLVFLESRFPTRQKDLGVPCRSKLIGSSSSSG